MNSKKHTPAFLTLGGKIDSIESAAAKMGDGAKREPLVLGTGEEVADYFVYRNAAGDVTNVSKRATGIKDAASLVEVAEGVTTAKLATLVSAHRFADGAAGNVVLGMGNKVIGGAKYAAYMILSAASANGAWTRRVSAVLVDPNGFVINPNDAQTTPISAIEGDQAAGLVSFANGYLEKLAAQLETWNTRALSLDEAKTVLDATFNLERGKSKDGKEIVSGTTQAKNRVEKILGAYTEAAHRPAQTALGLLGCVVEFADTDTARVHKSRIESCGDEAKATAEVRIESTLSGTAQDIKTEFCKALVALDAPAATVVAAE